jgi:CheY-like chemotaxis protein
VRTLLIVEDDTELRHLFRTALSLGGYRVQEAGDGLEALKLLDSNPPDLVVLDLGLPLVSGHEVREEIAAQAHTRHIPIVVVTGSPVVPATLDVACVLYKPVSVDELLRTVTRCIEAVSVARISRRPRRTR